MNNGTNVHGSTSHYMDMMGKKNALCELNHDTKHMAE